jgi:hypothetical protein
MYFTDDLYHLCEGDSVSIAKAEVIGDDKIDRIGF